MQGTCRVLTEADTSDALALYSELTFGPKDLSRGDFLRVIAHPGTTVFGLDLDGALAAMMTLHVLPNVTWSGRPYALIENVVTRSDLQGRGHGKHLMRDVCASAWAQGVFKIMLLTGQKRGATGFYEACGFSSEDKTAMVIRAPDAV